jgi:hypothetical protein
LQRPGRASTSFKVEQTRGMPTFVLVALAAVVAVVLVVHFVRRSPGGPVFYAARPALTPGVLNPDVTQATIAQTICARGWTKTVRPPASYTNTLKLEQMHRYGFTGGAVDYQEDHFISLELGGDPRDPRNLWPERRPRADRVDSIENELNAKVCSGDLSLAEAQRREADLKWTEG